MSFLSLRGVEKTFPDGTAAVRGVSLEVEEGEFVVLLGPSGCGKTTTLRMTAGLESPTGGEIRLDGRDVTRLAPGERDIGFVFQSYALYPHLSVAGNVKFPLESAGVPPARADERVREMAARMGLAELLDLFPAQLSGGDRQRVALARAMARRPRLCLMDEPLGTMDAEKRLAMREYVREHQRESGVTTLYVTHDQEEALTLADRVVVMESGVIRHAGPPEEVYERPADTFVARFVGSPGMNLVRGEAVTEGGVSSFRAPGGVRLGLPEPVPPGPVILGVRPEHLAVDPAGPVRGTVIQNEYLGSSRCLHVALAEGAVAVRAAEDASLPSSGPVALAVDLGRAGLYDAQTGRRR